MWKLDTVSERPFLILRKQQDERWGEDIKHSIRKARGEKREVGIDLGKETNQDKKECQDIPGVRYRSRNARGRHMQEGWKWERKQSVGDKVCKVSDNLCHITGLCEASFYLCKTLWHRQANCCNLCFVDRERKHRKAHWLFLQGENRKGRVGSSGCVTEGVTVIGKPPGSQGGAQREHEEEAPGALTGEPQRSETGSNIRPSLPSLRKKLTLVGRESVGMDSTTWTWRHLE